MLVALCRERTHASLDGAPDQNNFENQSTTSIAHAIHQSPPKPQEGDGLEHVRREATATRNSSNKPNCSARSLLKSASISGSKCVVIKNKQEPEVHALCRPCNLLFPLFKNIARDVHINRTHGKLIHDLVIHQVLPIVNIPWSRPGQLLSKHSSVAGFF